MENKYTTSSVKKANGPEQKQKVNRVTKGSVKAKKKSEIASVAKSIVSDECKNIKQYIIYDVVVPVIKNTLSQIITGATDMIFFGEVRSSKSSWGVRGGSTKISYKDYWEGGSRSRQNNRDYRPSNRVSYDELYFESREDAANVLESMDDIVEQYGVVTVADLFDLAGVSGNGYTDQNYGWTSTNSADIFRDRDGAYRIKLLRPSPIK